MQEEREKLKTKKVKNEGKKERKKKRKWMVMLGNAWVVDAKTCKS